MKNLIFSIYGSKKKFNNPNLKSSQINTSCNRFQKLDYNEKENGYNDIRINTLGNQMGLPKLQENKKFIIKDMNDSHKKCYYNIHLKKIEKVSSSTNKDILGLIKYNNQNESSRM